jgi:hypothetical protein
VCVCVQVVGAKDKALNQCGAKLTLSPFIEESQSHKLKERIRHQR